MDEVVRNKILKLKELCEKGVGGEKENALKLYDLYIKKYEINEAELDNELYLHSFKFHHPTERQLLVWLYYKVIGDFSSTTTNQNKYEGKIAGYMTDLESDEINFLFNFYNYYLSGELETFTNTFCKKQGFLPETNTRKYKEGQKFLDGIEIANTKEVMALKQKMIQYSKCIDVHTPIHEGLESL